MYSLKVLAFALDVKPRFSYLYVDHPSGWLSLE